MGAERTKEPRVIVRLSREHGRGIFARRALNSGERLIEYKGARVDWSDACIDTRAAALPGDRLFLLGLRDGRVFDGARKGNVARWINHSCAPNAQAVERSGRIFILARQHIAAGEEITIDCMLPAGAVAPHNRRERFFCGCGARSCRGTLLAVQQNQPLPTASCEQGVADYVPCKAPLETPPSVRIMERLAHDRILVCWRQPGRACYTEQVWRALTADGAGLCVMSRVAFQSGARVFAPTGRPRPLNCDARILAIAIATSEFGPAA
ncbi:SET domain-containing protein [Paraburkholderia sacchari]|uniref:SET domain-containing protein n=1 Tax=Paraburkholderia sacchari TaxID=159450 RepID=UPI003CC82313